LSGEGGVGETLLIAGHSSREDQLSLGDDRCAEEKAAVSSAVGEKQQAILTRGRFIGLRIE
jgi:hypothetical protein